MTNDKKMLPIGIEFFDTMIKDNYYCIDKIGLIVDLLKNKAGVTLFTRPRRFGKSLNRKTVIGEPKANMDVSVHVVYIDNYSAL